MILRPNSIILPDAFRHRFIVTVNEYPPTGFPVGHVDVTFFDHGMYQGTFGRNSVGIDADGKYHPTGKISYPSLTMPGGVFPETNAHAMAHFVFVSGANYRSMIAFAESQAQLKTLNKLNYNFLAGNCADLVYQVFQHSSLPPQYRNVNQYLRNHREPVAIYAEEDSSMYGKGSEKWNDGRRELERGIIIAKLLGDANAVSLSQKALH